MTPGPGIEPGPHRGRRALSPLRHPCSPPLILGKLRKNLTEERKVGRARPPPLPHLLYPSAQGLDLPLICWSRAKQPGICFISSFVFVSHLGLFEDAVKKDALLKRELEREDAPLVTHRTGLDSAQSGRSPRHILTFNQPKKVAVSII